MRTEEQWEESSSDQYASFNMYSSKISIMLQYFDDIWCLGYMLHALNAHSDVYEEHWILLKEIDCKY